MLNTTFPFYMTAILLSLVANIFVVNVAAKRYRFTRDELIGALCYENAGIILGAMALSYLHDPETVGLSAYGAVIGAILCLLAFGLQFKKTVGQMLFAFMPSIPVMYAIGKLGCFMVGCCHGVEYNGWGSVAYPYTHIGLENARFFPVQLAETLVFTGIFIYMMRKIMQNRLDTRCLGVSFVLCGGAKFALDYLRISHAGQVFSLNQIISIAFIAAGLLLTFIRAKDTMTRNHTG
jgi:prolipoprotein diacylglyceryltransferase